MIETVIEKSDRSLLWLDVTDPKKKELSQLAKDYGLPSSFVQDCLDPEHLPKFERLGTLNFLILRQYDEGCSSDSDEVLELTRKVAIFFNPNLIITVHRKPQRFLTEMKDACKQKVEAVSVGTVVSDLMYGVANTFEHPLESSFNELEKIETGSVESQSLDPSFLKNAYYLKRKANVFKRILRLTMDVFTKTNFSSFETPPSQAQDLKEKMDSLYFYSDQLLEDTTTLLNLHISLSAQRTNEVVRLLTVFSLFFLPLNFVASIYGMNFEFMPEISNPYGYPLVLLLMALIATGIFVWFRRKGWI